MVLLPFHLWLGEPRWETGEGAARAHCWGCSLHVLCPVPARSPTPVCPEPQAVPALQDPQTPEARGPCPGGLAASGGSRQKAVRPPSQAGDNGDRGTGVPWSQGEQPPRLRKGAKGDTRAGPQQVDLGCGVGVGRPGRSPAGQEQGDSGGHLAGAGQLSRDIVERMLELCGPARPAKVTPGQMCV